MAKTYEELKKEWLAVKKGLEEANDDLASANESRGMMDGTIEQGAKEIGRRIRTLRQEGRQGDKIEDFRTDPEVAQMLKGLSQLMAGIEKNINGVKTNVNGPYAKLSTRYTTLLKTLNTEVNTRAKAVSTKVGLGNKSLPKLKELLKEVNELDRTHKYVSEYGAKRMPKIESYEKLLDGYLQAELKKSAQESWTEDQAERFERLLVDRNLAKNFGACKALFEKIKQGVQDVSTAKKRNEQTAVTEAQNQVRENAIALEKIVAEYISAYDSIGEEALSRTKSYAKIKQALDGMRKMLTASEEALKKI